MIRAALFLAIAIPASAQWSLLGGGSDGFSVWHGDHWDVNGVHVDPVAAPEASPMLAVLAAGAALVLRRNGGAR